MVEIILEDVAVHFPTRQARALQPGKALSRLSLGGIFGTGAGGVGITALHGVNLKLKDGDRLGIIGHNGAGKTTLLRVMSGILPPSQGRIRVEGRVSALLSISLGLDAEATGIENIRYRARHMGISEAEIDAQFDDIAEFSELGDYLHLPMKSYSSGMKLRLALAIATAFQPDILVLDEWLSAGDERFRKKATERLTRLMERAGIVVFASHNMNMLSKMCDIGVVLDHSELAFIGPIDEAIAFSRQEPDTAFKTLQKQTKWPDIRRVERYPFSLDGGGRDLIVNRLARLEAPLMLELGSQLGGSTHHWLASHPKLKVIAVDRWPDDGKIVETLERYDQDPVFQPSFADIKDRAAFIEQVRKRGYYRQACANIAPFAERCVPYRSASSEALVDLAKEHRVKPDLVYFNTASSADQLSEVHRRFPKAILSGNNWNWGADEGYPIRAEVQKFAKQHGFSVRAERANWIVEK